MSNCCSEANCRRSQPLLVRPEPFGGAWVAVTRYRKRGENGIVADEKHRLDPVSQAEIELNGSVLHDLGCPDSGPFCSRYQPAGGAR